MLHRAGGVVHRAEGGVTQSREGVVYRAGGGGGVFKAENTSFPNDYKSD